MMNQLDSYQDIDFLVVDDFQGFRGVVRDILREKGGRNIEFCNNGAEAMAKLEKKSPDVVLCDYNLGDGRNGQQILEEAKVRGLIGPACAWIMITGEKTTEVVFSAAEYQPDAYLVKPITSALLFARLEKIWVKKEGLVSIDRALRAKEFQKALRLCDERMLADKTSIGEIVRLKCNILMTLGDLDGAADTYKKLLARRDFHWARTGLGKILFMQGKLEDARSTLEAVVVDNPSYIEAYDWLAKTLQALKEAEEAKAVLTKAVRLSPNSPTRQKLLGDVAYETGDLELAKKAFQKSVSTGENSVFKSADVYFSLAKTCSARHEPGDALRVLSGLKKEFKGPDIEIKSKVTEGLVYQENNQPDKAYEAATALLGMLEVMPVQLVAGDNLEMAQLLMQAGGIGEREKALELMRDLVKNNLDNPTMMADINNLFADSDMAEAGSRMVAETKAAATELMNKGVLLMRDEKYDEALEAMREARQAMPGNVRVLFNTAYVAVVWLEQRGLNDDVVNEARSALAEANRIQLGDKRYFNFTSRLEAFLNRQPS